MSQRVIITGASSGIGKALTEQFAAQGYDVGVCARRTERLEQLCQSLSRQYPNQNFFSQALDINQLEQVPIQLNNLNQQLGSVDIIIANAGITSTRRTGTGTIRQDIDVIQTNLLGAIATIDAAISIFRQQDFGHLVGISSISAFRGIPGSAAYSASKAALSNYLDAVSIELHKKRIQITTIHPGFIETDISSNIDKFPFVISAEKAAKQMYHAIRGKKREATVPAWPWTVIKHIIKLLPDKTLAKVF